MKTRRVQVKKTKSRRFRMKRGGEINKKDPNMPIIASQMGGTVGTMLTATGTDAATLTTNINNSLKTFGNAIKALKDTVASSVTKSEEHMAATKIDAANAVKLQKISEMAFKAFLGDSTALAGTPAATGVFGNVLINSGTGGVTPAYEKDASVAPTPAADLIGAYNAALSEFKTNNPTSAIPTYLSSVALWASSEGITTTGSV